MHLVRRAARDEGLKVTLAIVTFFELYEVSQGAYSTISDVSGNERQLKALRRPSLGGTKSR